MILIALGKTLTVCNMSSSCKTSPEDGVKAAPVIFKRNGFAFQPIGLKGPVWWGRSDSATYQQEVVMRQIWLWVVCCSACWLVVGKWSRTMVEKMHPI